MSTLEGTTMHPRCRHIGACWDLLEWFQLFGTSQNSNSNLKKKQVKTQFRIFFSQIIMNPCCSILEDISIDVSIANVGLILTKLRWFQHFSTSQNSNFELFWKKFKFFGLASCNSREDLSIDVSITNVGLILTKLRWFQLFVKSKIRISNFFEKKKFKFWGFQAVLLVKIFPLMYQLLM